MKFDIRKIIRDPFANYDPLNTAAILPDELPWDLNEVARRARRFLQGCSRQEIDNLALDIDKMETLGTSLAAKKSFQEAERLGERVAWITDLDRVRAFLDSSEALDPQFAPDPSDPKYLAAFALAQIGRLVTRVIEANRESEPFVLDDDAAEFASDAREAVSLAEGLVQAASRRTAQAKKANGRRWERQSAVKAACIQIFKERGLEKTSNARTARIVFERLPSEMKHSFESYNEPLYDSSQACNTIARWLSSYKKSL